MSTETRRVGRVATKPSAIDEETSGIAASGPVIEPSNPQKNEAEQESDERFQFESASAAQPEAAQPYDPKTITRKSRRGENTGMVNFDLPEHRKRPGWDYEWKTSRVFGADVEAAEIAHYDEQGWRIAPVSDFPELCGPGYRKKYIERWGQVLYMRPMHLTLEARKEDYELAEKVKYDKLMRSTTEEMHMKPGMRATRPDISIEGVVGTHKPAA